MRSISSCLKPAFVRRHGAQRRSLKRQAVAAALPSSLPTRVVSKTRKPSLPRKAAAAARRQPGRKARSHDATPITFSTGVTQSECLIRGFSETVVDRITGAVHGADRIVVVAAIERFAQAADMHVDRALVDIDFAAPDAVEQLLAREHAARALHQKFEQAIF